MLKCFFDWKGLWTRLYVTSGLSFCFWQLNAMRVTNSDSRLHNMLAEGYQWVMFLLIMLYVSQKAAEVVMEVIGARFGVRPEPGQQITSVRTETKTEKVNVVSDSAR